MFDIRIAYEEDVDRAVKALEKFLKATDRRNRSLPPVRKCWGYPTWRILRLCLKYGQRPKNMEQWRIERELKKGIKETLHNEGVEIPYPRKVIINK